MNSPLTRLMWKEYRAQRLLWIVLFLAAFVFQLMFASLSPGRDSLFFVVTVIVLCFAAASGSLLFAAEIEERTEGLLRMLPCATRTLVLAKTGTMLLATVAMAIVLTMTHSLAGFLGRLVRGPGIAGLGLGPVEAVEVFALLAGVLLVFGSAVFASLLSRRVLYAVGLTAVFGMSAVLLGSLLAATTYLKLVSESRYLHCQLALIAILGLVACVVTPVSLSKRWHLGRLPRSFLPTPRIRFEVVTVRTSEPSIRQRLLQRIASWPASHTRITAMLMWRELRSAVPFGLWWLLAGVLVSAGRYFMWPDFYPWPALLLVVFIHQCGFRTNSDDQHTGASLLLANIGLCPRQVWLTKTTCWFGVMLAVGAVIVASDAVYSQISPTHPNEQSRIHQLVELIRVQHWAEGSSVQFYQFRGPMTVADRRLQIAVATSLVLAFFGSGQLMACWIRRSILSFAASGLILTAWMYNLPTAVVLGERTVWIATIPIALGFFIAAAVTSRSWLDRATGWRMRLQQVAWIVIPFIVFPSFAWIAWGLATAGT